MTTAGLLLAAGAGRRFGGPKALAELAGEPFVVRAARALTDGGCTPVLAVLGAEADTVASLLPTGVETVFAPDWDQGMGASVRAGLRAVGTRNPAPEAVLVHLVDLPGVTAPVIARMRAFAGPEVVARASYGTTPGHPVLFGRRWWAEIADTLAGDRGAREWLAGRNDLRLIDCADLGTGADVDTPADLPSGDRGGRAR